MNVSRKEISRKLQKCFDLKCFGATYFGNDPKIPGVAHKTFIGLRQNVKEKPMLKPQSIQPLMIFYDADCPLCQRSRQSLEQADQTKKLCFMAIQNPEIRQYLPDKPLETLKKTMHALLPNQKVVDGPLAYREIGKAISPYSKVGLALKCYVVLSYIPGMLTLLNWIYPWIAKNRYRLSLLFGQTCENSVCPPKNDLK